MKDIVAVSLDREQLEAIDADPIRRDISRSAYVRCAISAFLAKRQLEKKEAENEKFNDE